MKRVLELIQSIADIRIKHLAGQHDQRSHGYRFGKVVTTSYLKRRRGELTSEQWEDYKRRIRDRRDRAALSNDKAPADYTNAAGRKKINDFEFWHRSEKFETAMAVDRDGNEIFTQVGGKDYVQLDPPQLAKTTGGVFTHVHPSGRSFSVEDIMTFAFFNMGEIRAVGVDDLTGKFVNYIMRPKEPGKYPRRDQVYGAFNVADQMQKDIFWLMIWDGKLTVPEAEHEHGHEIWKKIAPELGLEYTREVQD